MNQNSGYGQAQIGGIPFTTGKVFIVAASGDANFNDIDELFIYDDSGVARRHTTITSALAACVTGRGDIVLLSPNFTSVITAAELLSAETKGVIITQAGKQLPDGTYVEYRTTAALPQTAAAAIFTVTGRVKLLNIVGEVTTVIQTQANNTKLVSNPTVGADVDICAVADITAATVGSQLSITGTLATALQKTVSGAYAYQASPVVVTAGTIDLNCAASNTGSVKWLVQYLPIDPGARIIAA